MRLLRADEQRLPRLETLSSFFNCSTEDRLSGSARVRLRLRSRDSLALRQMPPLPVLPQLPLESSSAADDVATHGSVGDGRMPARRPSFGRLLSSMIVVGAGRGF